MNSKVLAAIGITLTCASAAGADHNDGFCVRATVPIRFTTQLVLPGESGLITDLGAANTITVMWMKTYDASGRTRLPNYRVVQINVNPTTVEVAPCAKHGTWNDGLLPVYPNNRPPELTP